MQTVRRSLIYITIIMCCILILPSCAAPTPTPTPPEPQPVPKTAPAKFEVTSLTVTPIIASPGQAVTVEVEVTNAGGTEGSYTVAPVINGVEEQAKDVTVAPWATGTVAFTLVRDASGMYDIKVSGLTETLRVKQPGAYPRLANFHVGANAFYWRLYYMKGDELNPLMNSLARWDLIVVHYDVVRVAPDCIRQIRKLNPQAKILAYIEGGTGGGWQGKLTDESFFLHYGDTSRNPKSPKQRRVILWTNGTTTEQWPGMNPTSEWSTYLPNFVHDKVMSSGLFDGVFYDCFYDSMWLNNIDIDNDGAGESLAVVNREYKEGMARLLQLTRELLGPEAIIFGNPGIEWSANSPYFEYANGHMQECALGGEIWSSRDFSKVWDIYQRNMQKPAPPSRIHWIGSDTNDVPYNPIKPNLPAADLQRMRYGLAITLLDDGYFGFDIGNDFHGELWWFPEYDANLGLALGDAQKRIDGSWMREFENGMVVANPTAKNSTIVFAATYKDMTTGIEGTQFSIPSKDGRIFVVDALTD